MWRRWRALRAEEANGTFSLDRYKTNPVGYFAGPSRSLVKWAGYGLIGVVVMIVIEIVAIALAFTRA